MSFLKFVQLTISPIMICSVCHAFVNSQNGKYAEQFEFLGGELPSVQVVYNSMTPFRGIFGRGWGSEFETRLQVTHEGVSVQEFGEGAQDRFFSTLKDPEKSLQQDRQQLLAWTKKSEPYWSAEQVQKFKQRLEAEPSFYLQQWKNYEQQNHLKTDTAPVGSEFRSGQFQQQLITRVKKGYLRQLEDGRTQLFSERGRLKELSDAAGNTSFLNYSEAGVLSGLTTSSGQDIDFVYNDRGCVIHIEVSKSAAQSEEKPAEQSTIRAQSAEGGKVARQKKLLSSSNKKVLSYFEYDSYGNLTDARLQEGLEFSFRYEPALNLLKQVLQNKKLVADLSYEPLKGGHSGWLKSFKSGDALTTYSYEGDSAQAGSYGVQIESQVESQVGRVRTKSSLQFFSRVNKVGNLFVYKLILKLQGKPSEFDFADCCRLPVHVRSPEGEVSYKYDSAGLLTQKTSSSEVVQLSYDKGCALPVRVSHAPVSTKSVDNLSSRWTQVEYSDKCLPSSGKDSEGNEFKITYNAKALPIQIHFGKKNQERVLNLRYETDGSFPVEVQETGSSPVTRPEAIQKILGAARTTISVLVNEVKSESIPPLAPL
jgi:YD repeat-containing protein